MRLWLRSWRRRVARGDDADTNDSSARAAKKADRGAGSSAGRGDSDNADRAAASLQVRSGFKL